MVRILPETFDDTWHESIQYLWLERATLRLVFKDELDDLYNSKYNDMLYELGTNRIVETDKNTINLFNHLSDTNTWRHEFSEHRDIRRATSPDTWSSSLEATKAQSYP